SQLHLIGPMAFWVPHATPLNLLLPFLAFTNLHFPVASSVFDISNGHLWPKVLIGIVYGCAFFRGCRKGPRSAWFWLGMGLVLPFILSYRWPSIFVWYRFPMFVYPAFVLIITSGLISTTNRRLRWGMVGLLLLAEVCGAWMYFHSWQKANPKAVVAYVHSI